MADHPFGDPFAKPQVEALRCPVCKENEKITPGRNQWGIWYVCDKCGNRWSGGMGVAQPDPGSPVPVPGIALPDEDDYPEPTQWGRVGFRDPRKNYGGSE